LGQVTDRILVRATINLPGLAAGVQALVDPEDEYMRRAIEAKYLVRVGASAVRKEERPAVALDESELVRGP
jgi:hypothetical protein